MNKLIFLFVAILATFASVNAQSAPVTVSPSFSQTLSPSPSVTGSPSVSATVSVSPSGSMTVSTSVSNSLSSSVSTSLSQSASVSASNSISATVTQTTSGSLTPTQTGSGTPTMSGTPTSSASFSNTVSGTQSVTQTGSLSASYSMSVSAAGTPSGLMSPAPPPASVTQVTTGCGAGRKQICVSWTRPSGVPANNYVVTVTGQISGQKWVYNFTNGETFAMATGLQPSTAYVVTIQTLYMGVLSSPATITITTAAPGPKQVPSLGITGFSCRTTTVAGPKKLRGLTCSWTNGSVAYTAINLRIKCTGLVGSGQVGKHKHIKRMIKPGQTSWTEKGIFVPARCKVIANAAYSTGPGRRIVTTVNVL